MQTPAYSPPQLVYEKVKENNQTLSRNGGYIFAGVHNIPGNTPKEHLRAILDAYTVCCT